jgi:hypothetical protein
MRDSVDKVLSKGTAILHRDEGGVLYYPSDQATLETVRGSARIVFLDSNESFKVGVAKDCEENAPHKLHFHLRLA